MSYTNDREHKPSGNLPDEYDRLMGSLHGLPGSLQTAPSTVRTVQPLLGSTQTWTVTSHRQRDEQDGSAKDHVFIERISADGGERWVLPHAVVAVIMRQHDALIARSRSKAAKAIAAERKAAGKKPGFQMTAAERAAARREKRK